MIAYQERISCKRRICKESDRVFLGYGQVVALRGGRDPMQTDLQRDRLII